MKEFFWSKIEKITPNKYHDAVIHEGFRRYFSNTGWLFVGQIVSLLISFFVGAFIARHLGPEYYGILNYVISFVTIFGIFFCFSFDAVLSREFIKHPEKEKELLGTFWLVKLIGGILTLVSATLFALFAQFDHLTFLLIVIFSTYFIIQSTSVISLFFQAKVQSKKSSKAQIAGNILSSILKIAWLFSGTGLIWLILIYISDVLFNGIFLIYYYQRSGGRLRYWRYSWEQGKKFLRAAWLLMFSGLAIFAILKIDQIIIGELLNKTAVGYYAVADKLTEVWDFIPRMICVSLFPAIINARMTSGQVYNKRLKRLYWLMFILAILIMIFTLAISKPLILWLFGGDYYASINILRVYILSLPGIFLFTAANQRLLAESREKVIFIANFIGLAINVSLNFILLPRMGLLGAAWATVITFVFLALFMMIVKQKKV